LPFLLNCTDVKGAGHPASLEKVATSPRLAPRGGRRYHSARTIVRVVMREGPNATDGGSLARSSDAGPARGR
jgi:hypothetical protein